VRRSHMTARETLDHRLVNGEITSEQYDELRKKLDAPAPAPLAGVRSAWTDGAGRTSGRASSLA
jgi:hypothetical protein